MALGGERFDRFSYRRGQTEACRLGQPGSDAVSLTLRGWMEASGQLEAWSRHKGLQRDGECYINTASAWAAQLWGRGQQASHPPYHQ